MLKPEIGKNMRIICDREQNPGSKLVIILWVGVQIQIALPSDSDFAYSTLQLSTHNDLLRWFIEDKWVGQNILLLLVLFFFFFLLVRHGLNHYGQEFKIFKFKSHQLFQTYRTFLVFQFGLNTLELCTCSWFVFDSLEFEWEFRLQGKTLFMKWL